MAGSSLLSRAWEIATQIFWGGLALIGLAIAAFFFVVFVGRSEERFECAGVYSADGTEKDTQAFARFERNRWPVTMWGDSGGSMKVEVPNKATGYFRASKTPGDYVSLMDLDNKIMGNFSRLSYAIDVEFPIGDGRFVGVCRRADE